MLVEILFALHLQMKQLLHYAYMYDMDWADFLGAWPLSYQLFYVLMKKPKHSLHFVSMNPQIKLVFKRF